jgi:hypothetical protein
LAADLGMLAQVPKLVAIDLAFSARSFGAEEAPLRRCAALGLVTLLSFVVGCGRRPCALPLLSLRM